MPRKNRSRARSNTWNEYAYKERKKEKNQERKKAREIYFEKFPHECLICGYTNIVEVHHIIELSRFQDPADGNGIVNMAGLCPNHHGEFHRKMITEGAIQIAKASMEERLGFMPQRIM